MNAAPSIDNDGRPDWAFLARRWLGSEDRLRQAAILTSAILLCSFLFLVLHLSPTTVLIGVGGIGAVVLSLLSPRLAVGVLVFSLFFGQGETSSNLTIVRTIGLLALGASLMVALVRRRTFSLGNLGPWFAIWALWLCASYLYAHDLDLLTFELRAFLANLAIYAMVVYYFNSWQSLRRLLFFICLAIMINCGISIVHWAQGHAAASARAEGLRLDSNFLGSLCVACAAISMVELWSESRGTLKLLWAGTACASFFTMLLTASRTAHVTTLVLGAFLFLTFPRRRPLLGVLAVVLILLFPYAPATYRHRVGELMGEIARSVPASEQRNLNVRGYLFKAGVKIWRDHFWVGAGAGSFRKLLLTVGYNPGGAWEVGFAPHNAYIGLLAEGGVAGLGIYGGLLGVACWNFVRGVRKVPDPGSLRWRTALHASIFMLVHLVMSLTIPILDSHSWYVAMAAGVIIARPGQDRLRS